MIETFGTLYRQSGHDFPAIQRRSESISSAVPGSGAYEAMTFGSPTYTGRSVNPNTAMTYTAVWACMKILSECVSSIPLLTYRNISADGLVTKLAVDDYRYRMLREQPNAEMSSMQWREFVMTSLLGWGNSYNFIDMDGRSRIKQIYPLRPDWMTVMRNPQTLELEYRYTPLYPFAAPVSAGLYRPDQILHIPGMGWDGIVGYSPITMCRNAIALGQAYEEHGGARLEMARFLELRLSLPLAPRRKTLRRRGPTGRRSTAGWRTPAKSRFSTAAWTSRRFRSIRKTRSFSKGGLFSLRKSRGSSTSRSGCSTMR